MPKTSVHYNKTNCITESKIFKNISIMFDIKQMNNK